MKTFQTLVLLLMSSTLIAQFSGYYDPSNWSHFNSPCGNGSVDASGAPASVLILGANNSPSCNGNYTHYQITVPTPGTITFDWLYTTFDIGGSSWDPFGYSLNGTRSQLSVNGLFGSQSGSSSIAVNAGDVFGFYVFTVDDALGRGQAAISNFSGPFCDIAVTISQPSSPIYYGYAPLSCTVLEATATTSNGAVSYTWSVDGDPNDPGQYATVCASSPDCIVVTVTAEDAAGCTAEATMLVEVVDVRCFTPSGQQKVELCHNEANNPHTICVSANAVPDHLAHGDQLGACGEVPSCEPLLLQQFTDEQIRILEAQAVETPKTTMLPSNLASPNPQIAVPVGFKPLTLHPNPAKDFATLNIIRGIEGKIKISVLNQMGQVVLASNQEFVKGTPVELNVASLANGLYEVKVEMAQGISYTEKLAIVK